eukprot:7035396-Pyramimonas_sp.AAC.1
MMLPNLSNAKGSDSPLIDTTIKRWSKWFPQKAAELAGIDWRVLKDQLLTYPTAWAPTPLRGLRGGLLTTARISIPTSVRACRFGCE